MERSGGVTPPTLPGHPAADGSAPYTHSPWNRVWSDYRIGAASSANLGPGYDVLAIAIDLRCRVTVDRADNWEVVTGGAPATPETMALIQGVLGSEPRRVVIESDIPQAAGLGSSAALLVAAAAAGGIQDRNELHRAASGVEGHSDNVAAAVFGGLVAVDVNGVTGG